MTGPPACSARGVEEPEAAGRGFGRAELLAELVRTRELHASSRHDRTEPLQRGNHLSRIVLPRLSHGGAVEMQSAIG